MGKCLELEGWGNSGKPLEESEFVENVATGWRAYVIWGNHWKSLENLGKMLGEVREVRNLGKMLHEVREVGEFG